MKARLQMLLEKLSHGLVERDNAIKLALLTLLAGENLVLIGPPGTGKSLIARRIAQSFNSNEANQHDYFEYLLTKFSTPEEIFGPLSISELKKDRFTRNTAGYLPSVRVAFLDEIFKASSSILNALLTILNERIFHNGCQAENVPLQGLIAASNELPAGQEELSALYDRFLIRCFVDYVKEENIKMLFDVPSEVTIEGVLSASDLISIKELAAAVVIPQSIRIVIEQIWLEHRKQFKEDRREQLSDRRLRKVLNLLRVSAATNDRAEVDLSDVFLLKDCLWNHPDNVTKVQTLIKTILNKNRYQLSFDLIAETEVLEPKVNLGGPTGTTVKGYSGSGTEQDPLLIKNIDQLLGLSREDVGNQGYYFKQIADIDASPLTSWDAISFKGHYDGSGQTIIGRNKKDALFGTIHPKSSVTRLQLEGLALANKANDISVSFSRSREHLFQSNVVDCIITQCEAGNLLIAGHANGCKVSNCLVGLSLIGGNAFNCTIKECQVGSILIDCDSSERRVAKNCSISDCMIVLNYAGRRDWKKGGIVPQIEDGSIIENCLVTGQCSYGGSSYFDFSGFVYKNLDSQIRNCALGPLQRSVGGVRILERIAVEVGVSSVFSGNVAIDTVLSEKNDSEPDNKNGRSVASASFNQYFFEHSLNWDFTEVWYWDDKTNLPALRNVGIHAANNPTRTKKGGKKIDVLAQQLNVNLWL